MAVDLFLKIDGIKGESNDDKHRDEIAINSYSFGVTTEGTVFKPEAPVGQDFNFVSAVSKASPELFLGVVTGKHYKEATLTVRRAGDKPLEFLTYKLTDVIVTSHQQGASSSGDLVPTDQFSLDFAIVDIEYTVQNPDGTKGELFRAQWQKQK